MRKAPTERPARGSAEWKRRAERFGWSDDDVQFLGDDGKPLTPEQVKAMQAEARAKERGKGK